eukprot:SAG11_NODE_4642_length_1824_cov_1.534493_1_plen_66_part_00
MAVNLDCVKQDAEAELGDMRVSDHYTLEADRIEAERLRIINGAHVEIFTKLIMRLPISCRSLWFH